MALYGVGWYVYGVIWCYRYEMREEGYNIKNFDTV